MFSKQLIIKISIFIALAIVVSDSIILSSLYPGLRKILLVLFLIIVIPQVLSLKKIKSELVFMFISLLILSIYSFVGFGDEKLSIMIKILFYSLLFYFPGYWVGYYNLNKYKDIFINLSFIFYSFIVLSSLANLRGIGNLEDADRSAFSNTVGNNEDTGSIILFWPQVFQLLNLGFVNIFMKYKHILMRFLSLVLLIGVSIAIFFSTFSAAVSMLLFSTFLYVVFIAYFLFFVGGVKNSKNYYILIFSILLLFSAYFSIQYIFSGTFGEIGGSKDEINQLMSFDASNIDESKIDNITNSRGSLLIVSIGGFISSPIIGTGAFYNNPFAGGHSFIFDTLSSFGLLGSIPIFMIFILIISKAFRLIKIISYNSKEGFFILSFLVSTLTLLISSIINPYLLHSSMDYFIFFCGGYVSGFLDFKNMETNKVKTNF